MFFVPALTMRLLSEEKRSGTLEVLMTAPVNEISVVLGKFFAAWIFYMLLWLPVWLFLISLRYFGGEEFDYRPVLSFTVAMGAITRRVPGDGAFHVQSDEQPDHRGRVHFRGRDGASGHLHHQVPVVRRSVCGDSDVCQLS